MTERSDRGPAAAARAGVPPVFLVLSGPTREYLDPVRYLSNASSGKQGAAIADDAAARGCPVDLVLGPGALRATAPSVRHHVVVSARDMLGTARELHPCCDVLIAAAAVADYRPRVIEPRKHRREPDGTWTVELVPNPDILASLAAAKGARCHVGFALETDEIEANARRKLAAKGLDWIVANSPDSIDADHGRYVLLGAGDARRDLGALSKRDLARELVDLVLGPSGTRAPRAP